MGLSSRTVKWVHRTGIPRRTVKVGRSAGRSVGYSGPDGGHGDGSWGSALYRVVVPKQNLIVRIMDHDKNARPEDYLAAIRPYGLLGMAWAIWRAVPGVEAREAFRVARRVRREGEAEVLQATRVIAGYVQRRLLVGYRLRARLERIV